MIYLDTSVVLAELLAEDQRPPDGPWDDTLVSSRLLEYEVWTIHRAREWSARGELQRLPHATRAHAEAHHQGAERLLAVVYFTKAATLNRCGSCRATTT